MKATGRMERAILWVERVAGTMLGLVTILIVVSAVGRYQFAWPVPDAFDLSRLVLGIAIIWGFASLGYRGNHIKVDLLALAVGPRVRRVINAFAWSVLLVFTALLVWKVYERLTSAMAGGDATMDLRLPHWPFFAVLWAGLVVALFTTAARLWLIVRDGADVGEFEAIGEDGATRDPDDGDRRP